MQYGTNRSQALRPKINAGSNITTNSIVCFEKFHPGVELGARFGLGLIIWGGGGVLRTGNNMNVQRCYITVRSFLFKTTDINNFVYPLSALQMVSIVYHTLIDLAMAMTNGQWED